MWLVELSLCDQVSKKFQFQMIKIWVFMQGFGANLRGAHIRYSFVKCGFIFDEWLNQGVTVLISVQNCQNYMENYHRFFDLKRFGSFIIEEIYQL